MKVTPQIEASIIGDYYAGYGGTTIAKKYGLCKKTVQLIRERNGIKPRPLGVRGRRYLIHHHAFSKDTPETRYWVGVLLTDGCVFKGRGGTKIVLHVNSKDEEWVEQFRSFIQYEGPIYTTYKKNKAGEIVGTYKRLAVASDIMADELSAWGIVPRKTKVAKAIPSLEKDPDFWRGAIDGDGCLRVSKNGTIICGLAGWRALVYQFARMASVLVGTDVKVYPCKDKKGGRWWNTSVSSGEAITVIKHLYSKQGPRMKRKGDLAAILIEKTDGHAWRRSRKKGKVYL
jgi:hypothetical protein